MENKEEPYIFENEDNSFYVVYKGSCSFHEQKYWECVNLGYAYAKESGLQFKAIWINQSYLYDKQ